MTDHDSFLIQAEPTDATRQPLAVYHLSHDLRGPLNSILGFAELMLEGIEGPLTENQEEDISAIYQSGHALLRLITSLVNLSKLTAGRLKFIYEAVSLSQVIHSVIHSDITRDKPASVNLVSTVPDDLPPVWADAEHVAFAVAALLRYSFGFKGAEQILLDSFVHHEAVLLEMVVEGASLSPEAREELFDLVVHFDKATGRSELGEGGLDLPLVYLLLHEQQGDIRVAQTGEAQLTFILTLPQADAARSAVE